MKLLDFLARRWTLLLVILFGLTPLLWYKEGLIIAGGDNYFLLNPGNLLGDFLHTWTERTNFGLPNLQTFQLFPYVSFWIFFNRILGLSLVGTERLWSVSIFTLTGVSMYFLFLSLRPASFPQPAAARWGALLAATLYMFNMWVTIDVIAPVMRLVAALTPLFVLLWIKGLNEEKFSLRYPLSIGLLSLFLISSYANPLAALAVPLTYFLYFFFFLLTTHRFLHAFKMGAAATIFYLIFNLWWLLPYLASSLDIYAAAAAVVQSYGFLKATPIFEAFRFMGFWAFRSVNPVTKIPHIPYAPLYYEPLFLLLGYLLSLLALAAIVFKPKDRMVIFFTLLGLVGVFLSKGVNPPLGSLYQFLYDNLPGFTFFREPFARFTVIQVLSFSFLLGVTLSYLYNRWREHDGEHCQLAMSLILRVWPVGFLGAILLLAFPILTGQVLQDYSWHQTTYDAMRVAVPSYWSELDSWLKNNDPRAKILLLPRQSYSTCYKWDSGACTAGPVAPLLLANPLLTYPESRFFFGDPLLKNFFDLLGQKEVGDLSPLFRFFGVDYVLAENDLVWEGGDPARRPDFLKAFLAGQRSLSLKKSFGQLDLYEYQGRTARFSFATPRYYKYIYGEENLLPERLALLGEADSGNFYLHPDPKNPSPPDPATIFVDLTAEEESNGRLKFGFDLPGKGSYRFYWRKEGFAGNPPPGLKVLVDGQPRAFVEEPTPLPTWSSLGQVYLEAGKHSWEMVFPPLPEVLSEEGFFNGASQPPLPSEKNSWFLPADNRSLVSFILFSSVLPKASYKISFWYRNIGEAPSSFGIQYNTCRLPTTKVEFDSRELLREGCQSFLYQPSLPRSSSWRRFETLFENGPSSQTALIYFIFAKPEDSLYLRDLQVERVFPISPMLQNLNPRTDSGKSLPLLTYRQENSAKYYLWPKGEKISYELVLRQGFNRNWQVYLTSPRRFLGGAPWETFFLKSLPEERHFLVDGYANGWNIKSEDLKEFGDNYEIVVEYRPQSLYILGLSLLATGLLFGLIYFTFPRLINLGKWFKGKLR